MEDRVRSRVNVIAAMVARVGRAALDAVMLCDLFAVLAVDAIGIQTIFQPFKTGRIVRKLAVEVFLGVRSILGLRFMDLPTSSRTIV